MSASASAVAAGCVVAWLLISRHAERRDISSALALVVAGLVVANGPLAITEVDLRSETVRHLAEATLALVLFGDASRVELRRLRRDPGVAVRLLAIGLPLTVLLGIGSALVLLPAVGVWVAATIAATVAPTDAALGAPILVDERIPQRIRRALNVESGLNDGIVAPVVNLFIAAAVVGEIGGSDHVGSAVVHIVVGVLVGAGLGGLGGRLIALADERGWMADGQRPLAVLALAALAYAAALSVDGNGFVAAFVAGLAFGATVEGRPERSTGLTVQAAEGLTLVVWWIFGASFVVPALRDARWQDVVFAVLALTIVRMVPVALALLGTGLDRATVALVGWFGPRGLASVVFMLLAVDELTAADADRVLSVVTLTVALSVLAHGVSATPLSARYGRGRSAGEPSAV